MILLLNVWNQFVAKEIDKDVWKFMIYKFWEIVRKLTMFRL